MYQLLIADDEDTIRDGLQAIVNWEKLGFHVQSTFEDGRDVIRYLQTHSHIDAILTDIKMAFQSGLDVAKFASEMENPPKVILISAYQEVDLAIAAIKYNVTDYIVKPIDLDELTSVFRKVAKELDERYQAQQLRDSADSFQKSIDDVKEYFFAELMLGSLQSAEYLESLFHLLYPEVSFDDCTCFMAMATIQNYEDFLAGSQTHTANELYNCLKNCVSLSTPQIEFRLVAKQGCRLQLLGILPPQNDGEALRLIDGAIAALQTSLWDLFSVRTEISKPDIFHGIPTLLQNQLAHSTDPQSMTLKIEEQKKALYSALCDHNFQETESTLERLNSYLQQLDPSLARKIILEFCRELQERTQTPNLDLSSVSGASGGELTGRFQAFIGQLADELRRKSPLEKDVIQQAKDYIIQHITEDISLESIADHFYLSQCYFSRMFKAKTGENLIDFIIRQKMELACQLLKSSSIRVYEVGDRVGYKSARYFSKAFKQYTGLTPNAYRLEFLQAKAEERSGRHE